MDGELSEIRRIRRRRGRGLAFFLGFLRHPNLVGSIIPSSRFLERRLVDIAEVAKAKLVVELGPGTGGTTKAILDALPMDSKLLALEVDPEFVTILRSESDSRLIVHHGSAGDISHVLAHYRLPRPNVVVSGIPFSTMPLGAGKKIVREVWSCLAPGGRFVAYQFRNRVAILGRKLIGRPEIEVELLNAPPMRVYHWRKPGLAESAGHP